MKKKKQREKKEIQHLRIPPRNYTSRNEETKVHSRWGNLMAFIKQMDKTPHPCDAAKQHLGLTPRQTRRLWFAQTRIPPFSLGDETVLACVTETICVSSIPRSTIFLAPRAVSPLASLGHRHAGGLALRGKRQREALASELDRESLALFSRGTGPSFSIRVLRLGDA